MGRHKKLGLWVCAIFVALSLFGFLGAPPIIRSVAEKQLSGALERTVTIQAIRFNPYTLGLTIRGLMIRDKDDPNIFSAFEEIYINLQATSLFRRAVVIKDVLIRRPHIHLERSKEAVEAGEPMTVVDIWEKVRILPEPVRKGLRYSVGNIQIVDGAIEFVDHPKGVTHEVKELNLAIPFFSNIPYYVDVNVEPSFSAKVNGAPYALKGRAKPFSESGETVFDINVSDLDLPFYFAYVPRDLGFKLESGRLDVQTTVVFAKSKEGKPFVGVSGEISLKEFALRMGKDKEPQKIARVSVSIASAEPVAKVVKLKKVAIESPDFNVRQGQDGAWNFDPILGGEKKAEKQTEKSKSEEVPLSYEVEEIKVSGGKINFEDASRARPFKTVIDPLDLSVSQLTNEKGKKGTYTLSVRTESKEEIQVEGEISIDPLEAAGNLKLSGLQLKKYAPYYADFITCDVTDGRLDLATGYKARLGQAEPAILLSDLSTTLSALRLTDSERKQEFVSIPMAKVEGAEVDLANRLVKVGKVSGEKGAVLVKRLQNGEINLAKLMRSDSPDASKSAEKKPESSAKSWQVSLKELGLARYGITWEDETPASPVRLTVEDMNVRGENFSTGKDQKGKLSLSARIDKGSISASGTVSLDPLAADLRIAAKEIQIAPLQSYFTDKINITVTEGALSASGALDVGLPKEGPMRLSYKGDTSLSAFSSVEKSSASEFVNFKSLALTGMAVRVDPLDISVEGVSLADFYAGIRIMSDGRVNLLEAFSAEEKAAPSAPAPSTTQPGKPAQAGKTGSVKIGSVTLQGGKIEFSDLSIKPTYSAHVDELGGRISSLSSDQNTAADVEVRGKLNGTMPLEITGKINPLRDDLLVDLKARITDFDLSPMTPYSGKYAGYTIQRGKFSLEGEYKIVARKIDTQSRIFLDQFTFGERVDSPDATKLPVRLAVALLKDRKGEIRLDLPVSGSLDDPKFSIWRVVLQIILNLIAKAATSPFALLGAAFGGGEELSYVEFDYGSQKLAPENQKKIETLVKALSDRPSLRLDIEGYADPVRDREGLKQARFMRKLKVQKFNERSKQGINSPPADELTIEKAEYEKYLKLAYKAEKFPKPTNVIGMAKDLPVPETEKLMLTHTEVTDDDLKVLASERAANVRTAILASGQVESGRIFMVTPKSLSPEKSDKAKESRVMFRLK